LLPSGGQVCPADLSQTETGSVGKSPDSLFIQPDSRIFWKQPVQRKQKAVISLRPGQLFYFLQAESVLFGVQTRGYPSQIRKMSTAA